LSARGGSKFGSLSVLLLGEALAALLGAGWRCCNFLPLFPANNSSPAAAAAAEAAAPGRRRKSRGERNIN